MSTAGIVHPPLTAPRAETITRPATATRAAGVPWYIYCGALAVTSSSLGGNWDVAWHRSIGRDTFLTPAHVMIYACGVIAAVICAYLIFATTFGKSQRLRDESVSVLGFRAPLGAFVAAWGGIAMITSGPFDNWWHAAYGLDVRIISPPHTLLILGIRAVGVGVLFLTLAAMNREETAETLEAAAETPTHRRLRQIYLYMGGLMIGGQMFFLLEQTWDVKLHSASAYISMAVALPILFAMLSRSSGSDWACTITAAIYTVIAIAEVLIFPLVPAAPKLGPVFNPVTHLIPAKFPILIIVPSIALDLLWQRTRGWKTWKIAVLSGLLFTAVILAVEWPFATFLMSKASENRFFGTIYFDYNSRPDGYDRLREWFNPSNAAQMVKGTITAVVFGSIGTWVGLKFGNWMKSVQR